MDPQQTSQTSSSFTSGSHDGDAAADHDVPFQFGRRLTTECPFPFSTREFARLLGLRSRVQNGLCADDN
jgi:hypothetical protein